MGLFNKKKATTKDFTPAGIIGNSVGEAVEKIGGVIGGLVTTDHEKLELKNKLTEILSESFTKLYKIQSEVIIAEANGNWLQRSWRPIVMLVFAAVVVLACFYDVKLNEVPEDFWGLLKIGVGGYVGGRSLEKIATTVTKNVDLTFLKKKDRK